MTKIIFLNGPKGSGKDTAAEAVVASMTSEDVIHEKLSQPLKDIVSHFIGKPQVALENVKDGEYIHDFKTYRDLQIGVYENLSNIFGSDWLGEQFVNRILNTNPDYVICSDGGRSEDLDPVLAVFDPEDIMIIQIMREGCSFDGDIRGYVHRDRVITKHVVNEELKDFKDRINFFASSFFAGE